MKKNKIGLIIMLACLLACQAEESFSPERENAPFINQKSYEWADSMLQHMSLREQIGQLLIWQIPDRPELREDLYKMAYLGEIGGIQPNGFTKERFGSIVDSVHQFSTYPLFVAGSHFLLNNQFPESHSLPDLMIQQSVGDDSLQLFLQKYQVESAKQLGINLLLDIHLPLKAGDAQIWKQPLAYLQKERIINIVSGVPSYNPMVRDTANQLSGPLPYLVKNQLVENVGGWMAEDGFSLKNNLPPTNPASSIEEKVKFGGITLAPAASPDIALQRIQEGVDIVMIQDLPESCINVLQKAVRQGELDRSLISNKVRRVLMAKHWMYKKVMPQQSVPEVLPARPIAATFGFNPIYPSFESQVPVPLSPKNESTTKQKFNWEWFERKIYEQSLTLVSDPDQMVPIRQINQHSFRIVHFSDRDYSAFQRSFEKYADARIYLPERPAEGLPENLLAVHSGFCNILLIDSLEFNSIRDAGLIRNLRDLSQRKKLVILNFGAPAAVAALDTSFTILQLYDRNPVAQEFAAQALFGGRAIPGALPVDINQWWKKGYGQSRPVLRLGFALPEEVGIAAHRLVGIDAIARQAIRRKATPGCQVVVAHKGKIIYSKAFGHHTYSNRQRVKITDLYDLASVTKVAATTLVAMDQYERGAFELNDRIRQLIPDYQQASFRNVRIKELMTHQSGIQPHLPVLDFLLYRGPENSNCDSFFCSHPDSLYSIEVAKGFFFDEHYRDSIWYRLNNVKVNKKRSYRYSDVNMVLMQRLLEEKGQAPLDQLVQQHFFTPLGLRRTGFNPHRQFSGLEIVPTATDNNWRRQQLRGYVHDETAALLGGVAGHAGLFSNAEELAVIMQMLLNKGVYGGHQFVDTETLELFTSPRHGNHRGLGFDRPHPSNSNGRAISISDAAYGHTGFTGTCVWVDPEHDLVFVFLSNRIHPSTRNGRLFKEEIRGKIHEVVYQALDSFQGEWPDPSTL